MTMRTLKAPSHHVILAWLLLLATIACQAFAAAEEPVCKGSSESCANPDASSDSSSSAWWEEDDWTFPDLWEHFECPQHYIQPRPAYSLELWKTLRQSYIDFVGKEKSTIIIQGGDDDNNDDGFSVDVRVRQSADKGRGLFAAHDIKKGQHIWTGTKNMALLDSAVDYKRFLALLPPDCTCDILHDLGYVHIPGEDKSDPNKARITLLLDDFAFVNVYDDPPGDIGCLEEHQDFHVGGCELNFYALRDIYEGEEMLMNSTHLHPEPFGWEWFGLDEHVDWWETDGWDIPDLLVHFQCQDTSPTPIYTQATWMNLRQIYHDIVGSDRSSIGTSISAKDGFDVKIEIKRTKDTGRSLFAAQDIQKGELIWAGTRQTALFDNAQEYKQFLALIPTHLACDQLRGLAYVLRADKDDDKENWRIAVALDDAAFANTNMYDFENPDAGCLPEWKDRYPGGCELNYFALRDIKKGQEVFVDDDQFDIRDDWEYFGLGRTLWFEFEEEEEDSHLHDPWSHYDCDDASVWPSPRPVYSQDMWMRVRQAYVDIVGSTKSSIGIEASAEDGFAISTEVKQAPGKGRGLFVGEDISRGQLIWSSLKQTACFNSGEDFRNFLDALEVGEACDVIQWSYVFAISEGPDEGATQILTDLDNMTFVNHVIEDEADAGCLPEWEARHPGGCIVNLYALRDMKKGEEILIDYEEFAVSDGWSKFGLQ